MVYWIEQGKQGTGMPGFQSVLSDQDVRDVLAYIKNQQQSLGKAASIPNPSSCTIPPRTIADVEALVGTAANQPPVAATSSSGAKQPLQPASEPAIDTETQSQVIKTVEEMVACTNAVDTMRRLALFSDPNLKASFPQGVSPSFAQMATQKPQALPQTSWTSLLDVRDITRLTDGRISATVILDDPATHMHPVTMPGGTPAAGAPDAGAQKATIVFVLVEGRWLIDEIR